MRDARPHRDASGAADGELDAGGPVAEERNDDGDEIEDARIEAGAKSDAARGSSTRENLVIHEFWSMLDRGEDPFADAPADAGCQRLGIMAELLAEEPVFSVDTGYCGYVTVAQPTLHDVRAGDSIKVRLWHFELTAAQPAFAHAAVTVDGLAVLDEQIAIPGAGGLLTREVVVPRAIAAGAQVYFHLHNHGANSWSLVEVSAGPCSRTACP